MADFTTIKEDIDQNAYVYTIMAAIDTITAVITLVLDTAVTAITIYFAFREDTSRSFRDLFHNSLTPLTIIFVRQGLIMFLLYSFDPRGERKRQDPACIDTSLEIVISVILICRFLLELRRFTERTQSVPSVHIATLSGIQGQLSRLNASIIHEFNQSGMSNQSDCGLEDSAQNDEDNQASLSANSADIDLGISEEHPGTITAEV
ncbi:hypothetical protein M422DRAFT_239279 [Sphaerobolus stellatus SS14]|nr:hypothetical protein M422DRAFT_239279 [Sphaerobolus stellatus SS14]